MTADCFKIIMHLKLLLDHKLYYNFYFTVLISYSSKHLYKVSFADYKQFKINALQ